jgi:hypothetical protein
MVLIYINQMVLHLVFIKRLYDNTNFGLNASSQYSTGVVFNGVTYMGLGM